MVLHHLTAAPGSEPAEGVEQTSSWWHAVQAHGLRTVWDRQESPPPFKQLLWTSPLQMRSYSCRDKEPEFLLAV